MGIYVCSYAKISCVHENIYVCMLRMYFQYCCTITTCVLTLKPSNYKVCMNPIVYIIVLKIPIRTILECSSGCTKLYR